MQGLICCSLAKSELIFKRCGGQCCMSFIANFLIFLAVKILKIGYVLAKIQQVKPCTFFGGDAVNVDLVIITFLTPQLGSNSSNLLSLHRPNMR